MRHSLPLWAEQIAVFDTETTGVSPVHARIVTASLAVLGGEGDVSERYDWMLDPGIEIPPAASQVHGISTEMAREQGMDARVGIAQMVERIGEIRDRGLPLVIYNAPYDLTLLAHEAERYDVAFPEEVKPVLDPLIIDKQMDRYRRGKRTLTAACEHYRVELSQAHDAGADAIAAGHVLQCLARQYADALPDDLHTLHEQQVSWAAAQAENFEAYMRKQRDPAFTADRRWPLQHRV